VDAWQQQTGHDVVLVFDGPDRRELTGRSRPGFEVRFAERAGRNAGDDLVVRLAAERGDDDQPDTVVTSDAGLVARLPEAADVVGSGAFRKMLENR
jgi:hypothetical protein